MQAEQNELITRIGPGTPCGDVLRRYWQPAALVDEFDPRLDPRMAQRPVKAVRLLGQDLVLFRDAQQPLGPARPRLPAPRRRPVLRAGTKATACAARSTAGSSPSTAPAWKRRPSPQAASCASGCASAATRCSSAAAWSSPTWARRLHAAAAAARSTASWRPPRHSFAFKGLWNCNWLQAFEVGIDPAHPSFLHRFLQDEALDEATTPPAGSSAAPARATWPASAGR